MQLFVRKLQVAGPAHNLLKHNAVANRHDLEATASQTNAKAEFSSK